MPPAPASRATRGWRIVRRTRLVALLISVFGPIGIAALWPSLIVVRLAGG